MPRKAAFAALAVGTLVAMLLVLAGAPQPLRVVAGLALVFVLPGAAIVAVFASRSAWPAEKALLAVCTSLASAVVGGVALDHTTTGLTRGSWAAYTAYVTGLLFVVGAFLRRVERVGPRTLRGRAVPLPSPRQAVVMAAALGLAAVAIAIAKRSTQDATRAVPVVQLWMTHADTKTTRRLQIGIDTVNAPAATYRIEIRTGNERPLSWPVEVAGASKWRGRIEVPLGTRQRVDAYLFRTDRAGAAIRHVRQWIQ